MSTLEKETTDEVYRVYVTDSFKELLHLNTRYYDMIRGRREQEPTQTSDQIINRISNKLNSMKGKEEK